MRLFWICLGGAFGSGARYLISGWVLDYLGPAFPSGTLAVNAIGSFLLGALMFLGVEAGMLSPTLRLALTTGVMGGFTTYSTFSYETMRYLQDGSWALALVNVAVTVVGCLVACLLGWGLAQWLAGPSV
ncbi:MAG TPA: fluoride efflux transporter CrcB [Candidatus Dormibacteraeota bacterium]|nr:fluoride efflux transporter CrcB [Candidatus Dormibacteraeota bacterium]